MSFIGDEEREKKSGDKGRTWALARPASRLVQRRLRALESQNLKKFWQPDEQNIIFADWYYTLIELDLGSEKSAVHHVYDAFLTSVKVANKLRKTGVGGPFTWPGCGSMFVAD